MDVIDILDSKKEEDKKKSNAGVKEKYPFSELKVGQLFKIPEDKSVQSMRCLAYQRGVTLGKKFKVSVDGYVERIA